MGMDLRPTTPGLHRLKATWADIQSLPPVKLLIYNWHRNYGLLAVATGTALIAFKFIQIPGKAPDFTVFWAAATHAFGPIYDSAFLTPLQNGPPGPRPFANPPTFLLMLLPFGLVPFKLAYVAWVTATVALYFAVGLRLTRLAWLAMLSPTFLFVALIGQTTLAAGSLAVLGLVMAGQTSTVAGVLLGLAACIKPQLVILAPLALLLLRDARAFVAFGLTGLAMAVATTLLFGAEIWADWLHNLTGFQDITSQLAIGQLSLPRLPVIMAAGAIVFTTLMLLAVRDDDRPRLIIATIGGSVLLAPYAAHYESVVPLLPALALLKFNWRILPIGFLLSGSAAATIPFAVIMTMLAFPSGRLKPVVSFRNT